MKVPLLDLRAQYLSIKEELDEALVRVITKGNFVMGEEVEAFEEEWAAFCGAKYSVGVSSGTDALYLTLLALKEQTRARVVLTTPFTFFATTQAILHAGLTPAFMDVEEDGNIDLYRPLPQTFPAIGAYHPGPPDVLLPVHLYGRPARFPGNGLPVIEDAAQAHGIPYNPDARAACYSFYPSKNLGAMGQAGAVVTNDAEIAKLVRYLRVYGERERFVHYAPTGNHRLDELQAAILRVKLPHLRDWNWRRREMARIYISRLAGLPGILLPPEGDHDTFHIFAIRVQEVNGQGRDHLGGFLGFRGVETAVRYPVPLHLQPALSDLGYKQGDFPMAEAWARETLSLPINAEMTRDQVEYVVKAVRKWNHARWVLRES